MTENGIILNDEANVQILITIAVRVNVAVNPNFGSQ